MAKLGEQLGSFIFYLVLTISTTILRGYVMSILWLWFIVSTFQLPVLSIPEAIGVMIVVTLLTKQTNRVEAEREDAMKYSATIAIVWPLVLLSIGYVVKAFM